MILLRMILRNTLRHKLRTVLTMIAVGVALLAFTLLSTLLAAWYSAVDASSASRLVTRNAVSILFPMPVSYADRIRHIKGVRRISYGSWFGGIYKTEKNFFANFAIDAESYLDIYPEFVIGKRERADFLRDRRGFVAGKKLVDRFGWRIGDFVTLKGTIYPGDWDFVLRGVYTGKTRTVDETQFFFHWEYLNERVRQTMPALADQVGFFMIGVGDPNDAARVAREVDATFANSRSETLTESERAFVMGFISMSQAIVTIIRIVSLVVIGILLVVVANTMAMTTRERRGEYAVLRTLGFGWPRLGLVIAGEAVAICLAGCVLGVLGAFPVVRLLTTKLGAYFPVFFVESSTVLMDFALASAVGVASAVVPVFQVTRIRVAQALRGVG